MCHQLKLRTFPRIISDTYKIRNTFLLLFLAPSFKLTLGFVMWISFTIYLNVKARLLCYRKIIFCIQLYNNFIARHTVAKFAKKNPAAAPPPHSAEGQCSEIGAFTAFQQWSFVLKATLLCACCLDFWLDKKWQELFFLLLPFPLFYTSGLLFAFTAIEQRTFSENLKLRDKVIFL